MVVGSKGDLYKMPLDYGLEIDSEIDEKNLIDAVDRYLKVNYYELYNRNSLAIIFERARESKEMEEKIFSTISKFIRSIKC